MGTSKQTTIIAIILSVMLLIIGFQIWGSLFILILPIVGDVKYFATALGSEFRYSLLFGLTLALIPIATILIWKFAPIFTTGRKLLTIGVIVLTITSAIFIRREMIKSQARNLPLTTFLDYSDPNNPRQKTIESGIPISTLRFEEFALGGLVAGSFIAFFLLKEKAAV